MYATLIIGFTRSLQMPQTQVEVNYTADVRCRENIARSHRNFQHKSVLQIFKIAQYHIWDAILATRGSL